MGGLPPLAPQGDVNPQEENLRRLQDQHRDKQASMEYLAQQIELKQKEVEERRREKMIAKRKKAEEKRREEEEKRRVDDLILEQQQKEKSINDAIMNQLYANKNSDAEIQRMAEVLRSLSTMEVKDDDDDVEIIVTEEADNQNCAGAPTNDNKKRKLPKKSPPKSAPSQPPKPTSEASKAFSNFMSIRSAQDKAREGERVAPVNYQPGCGLHCASRGPHQHFQDDEVFTSQDLQ